MIAPAGESLLDNFYLAEEQIRTARRHLPEEYSSDLPHLTNGPLEGYPRVCHIARELIAHTDGRIDTESLFGFMDAYQSVTPLLLGELWAIPIMFRLALTENLRRVADIISENRRDRDSANYWVDRMTEEAKDDPKSLILVIADMARSDPPLTSAFVAKMGRKLQGSSRISSIHLNKTPEDVRKYRVEPYVIASDIYTAPPRTGRGGWTWYSGSSGWMYTLFIESLLGVRISGNIMRFDP